MEIIRHLSETIGERPSGTPAERRAAGYLADQFSSLGLQVEVQEFRFLGWRAKAGPLLRLLRPVEEDVRVAPVGYTGSTPPRGALGVLRRAGMESIIPGLHEWPRYAVMNGDGKLLAYVLGNVDGPAISLFHNNPLFSAPMVVISSADNTRLESWLGQGEQVEIHLQSEAEYDPDMVGHNVIATLPGRTAETVVACAHFDSVPGSPGAVDNASGVQVVFDLARRLSEERPGRTVKFILFGGEEDFLLGSRYYVREAKSLGILDEVKAVVNFDTVATGSRLVCRVGPESFEERVRSVLDRIGAGESFDLAFTPPWASSDHFPFAAEGVPALMLVLHPWDEYHTTADTMSVVDGATLEAITRIGVALVREVAG